MSELTTDLAQQMLPVCEENAGEIAEALTRGIDAEVSVTVGKSATYDPKSLPEGFDGRGLMLKMQFGDQAIAAVLPQTSGLVRGWMTDPDVTSQSMLDTLAQELSMLVVPDTMMSDGFGGAIVENIAQAFEAAELAKEAAILPLALANGDKVSHLTLVWPCANPAKLLPPPKPEPVAVEPEADPEPPPAPKPTTIEELPTYARHLLKVSVPVSVRLVGKRMSVQEIMDLGPGAMVSFEKSCDDTLELLVGDRPVARGAAVKVGEQFGIEVVEMTLPDEHFYTARR